MDRISLLAKIWDEKREKIVSDKIYPLGIGIFLGDPYFNAHEIIYGLISFLCSNPERSFVWSQNWGRTNVLLGKYNFPQFRFLIRESDEEKSLIPISTQKQLDPKTLVIPDMNHGHFKLLLNHEVSSVEGAVLQIERMVDELIWCSFLRMKNATERFGIEAQNLPWIYSKALSIVWRGGIAIDYVSEAYILGLKEVKPEIPVRVYGDKRKKQTIPRVIGAVLIPDNLEVSSLELAFKVEVCRKKVMTKAMTKKAVVNPIQVLPFGPSAAGLFVCTGITLGKIPHAGHLLLLVYADMVKRALCPETPLYIESNDIGPRVAGMVAKLAEELKVPVSTAVKLLCAGLVSVEVIERCYQNREQSGDSTEMAEKILSIGGYDVLATIRNYFFESLCRFGFGRIVVISDSDCLPEFNDFLAKIPDSPWSQYGFRFTVHQKQGGHIQTLIYETQNMPSACAVRVSFVKKASSLESQNSAVYVDMDRSVSEAIVALRDIEWHDVIQCHGTAIGFGLRIASGSSGDSVSMNAMHEAFLTLSSRKTKPSFLQALRFFILTRCETAESKRTHPHRAEIIGPTFYDYKDHKAFIGDFAFCVDECDAFLVSIANAKRKLCMAIGRNGVMAVDKKEECAHFIRHASQVLQRCSLDEIFPRARQVIPNLFFRQIYDQIKARVVYGKEDCFDTILIDGFVSGTSSVGLLGDFMQAHGMLKSPIKKNREKVITCLYVDNLQSRGYDSYEIMVFAPSYLNGRISLVKKRCLFFETLNNALRMIQKTERILQADAKKLLEIISVCEKKLGFDIPNS